MTTHVLGKILASFILLPIQIQSYIQQFPIIRQLQLVETLNEDVPSFCTSG